MIALLLPCKHTCDIVMQRLLGNRCAGENHFLGNCTGKNSKITVDAVVAREHGLSRANEEIGDFVVGKKGEVVGDQGDFREDIWKSMVIFTAELGRSSRGERPFASENKTREIVIALKRSGRTTMTAADAASCGYRSSLDIKKSDRAIFLSSFNDGYPPLSTCLSLSLSLFLSLTA